MILIVLDYAFVKATKPEIVTFSHFFFFINIISLIQLFFTGSLPKYAYPDLSLRDGYWVRAVPERLVSTGTKLMVYVSSNGQLQLFINGQHIGVLLSCLPTSSSLWLMVDVYGNTTKATFVKPGWCTFHNTVEPLV